MVNRFRPSDRSQQNYGHDTFLFGTVQNEKERSAFFDDLPQYIVSACTFLGSLLLWIVGNQELKGE